MGMFDTIFSSYSKFRGEYQTKDLDCFMADYWLSPKGELYEIDYSGTSDYVNIPEEERTTPWNVFQLVPNGNHGKIKPTDYYKYVRMYSGDDEITLHVKKGKVVAYQRNDRKDWE